MCFSISHYNCERENTKVTSAVPIKKSEFTLANEWKNIKNFCKKVFVRNFEKGLKFYFYRPKYRV